MAVPVKPVAPSLESVRTPALSRQPWAGIAGLVLVLAVAALLGIAPGLQRSLEVIGPWSTFCLPVLAVTTLWWNGWPFAGLSRGVAGLATLAVIIVAGLILTGVGQAVTGSFQPGHLLGAAAEAAEGHMVTFPWTVPLAAFVFVTTLQLTFVCRKWPFANLQPVAAGFAALATSWVVGLLGYFVLASWSFVPAAAQRAIGLHGTAGPVNALNLVGVLLCVVVVQMTVFFLLDGYPVSLIRSRGLNLLTANVSAVGLGIGLYFLLSSGIGLSSAQVSEVAGVIIAGTLVVGLLLAGWPARLISNPGLSRLALLASEAVVAVVLGEVLRAISLTATWSDPSQLWVAVTGLNFIAAFIIVHVAAFRRWPLPPEKAN